MYCVVQTIERKKANPHGAYRKYKVQSMSTGSTDGTHMKTHYFYEPDYNAGRFERPRKESFKISIHESRREGSRIFKKQCVIGTVGYYDLLRFSLFECIDNGIKRAAAVFGAGYKELYRLVENKMQPVIDKIEKEFRETEEYQAEEQRRRLEKAHQEAKKRFLEEYGVDEYDCCYNIFGELMDEAYLQQIIQHREEQRSYWKSRQSTYSNWKFTSSVTDYTVEETAILKQFYRSLSKLYHPDKNPDKDTTAEMQMLNRLKQDWGLGI